MTVNDAASFTRGLERGGAVQEAEARLDAMLRPAAPPAASRPMALPPSLRLAACGGAVLAPGTLAGLVGPSGCGKTTLLETLLRLREPLPGQVLLGGTDLAGLSVEAARRCFAFLPQDMALLAGSVRDNLLLAAPEADDATLWEALHDAALEERIRLLPGGLDGWLGENGARLRARGQGALIVTHRQEPLAHCDTVLTIGGPAAVPAAGGGLPAAGRRSLA